MAKRTFTKILVVLGLILNTAHAVTAQQVTFAFSPNSVSPSVGDTVNLDVVVTNFTNMISFQYTLEWDAAIFAAVRPPTGMTTPTAVDRVTVPDAGNFAWNLVGSNAAVIGWNATNAARTVANGQSIFRLRLKTLANSTNYWATFSSRYTPIDAEKSPGGVVTPVFVPLGNPPGSGPAAVAIASANASTQVNQSICVPVTTSDFTNIVGTTWTNRWNPAILRYDNVANFNATLGLSATDFTPNVAAGTLAFTKTYATPQTLPAATKLYDVCFTAQSVGTSTVAFEGSTVTRQTSGVNSTATTSLSGGTVTVNPPVSNNNLQLVVGNTTINAAGKASAKVRVANFTNIAAAQFTIRWDSTKMLFDSVRGTVLDFDTALVLRGGINGNFFNGFQRPTGNLWTGTTTFVWADGQGVNRSLPDSTILMELFFDYTGAAGSCSPVSILGTPRSISFGRVDDNTGNILSVVPTITQGSVCRSASVSAISVVPTLKHVTCPNGTDGTITLAVTGATGTYTYNWGGGITTQNRTGLAAGTYTVTITSGSETTTLSYTITQPTAFVLSTVITPVGCFGNPTGKVILTVTGGTPNTSGNPYTYLWSNGATTPSLDGVVAGTYSVTVTDSRMCVAPVLTNQIVTQPTAALNIPAPTITNVLCNGGANGSILVAPTGGTPPYTYNWTGDGGFTATTNPISNLRAGTYRLTVSDSKSCAQTWVGTVSEPTPITIGTATIVGTRCAGSTGSVTLSGVTGGNGGFVYSWSGPNGFTASSMNISNRPAGTYTLSVADSRGCTLPSTTYVVVDTPSTITIATPSVTNVNCNGGNNGSISLTVNGTAGSPTYVWTGPNGFTANTLNINNLQAGQYTFRVTDGSGCPATISATVTEPASLRTVSLTMTSVKCKNGSTGNITLQVAGGITPQYSYSWTGPNNFTSTIQSPQGLSAGKYVVTFIDNNNCEKKDSITVTEPDSLKITNAVVTNVNCNGLATGAVNITVAGGIPQYNFSWTGPFGTSTQEDISALRPGTYRVNITDANTCTTSQSYEITESRPIVITPSTTNATGAPNGSITISVTGGVGTYNYLWTGAGVAPTAQNQTGLCPGTYNVDATDQVGCVASRSITVEGACSALLTFTGSTFETAGCVGQNRGSATVNWFGGTAGANGFTVVWYRSPNFEVDRLQVSSRTSTIANLPQGVYYAVITDNSIPTRQSITTPNINVEGNLSDISVSSNISSETCIGNNGGIQLNVTGGAGPGRYEYRWNEGSTSKDLVNKQAGTYSVTITDANRCVKEANMLIISRIPCALSATTQSTDVTCFGGSDGKITVNITNGEPVYKIKWVGSSINDSVLNVSSAQGRAATHIIDRLSQGTYTITITDTVRNRQTVLTARVDQPTMITVNRQVTGATNGCNGSIVLSVGGGSPQYTYLWNTGATSRDLFNLCPGPIVYSVTVTDSKGCQVSTGNDTIPSNYSALAMNSNQSDPICKNDSTNWRVELAITGGSQPYTYRWSNDRGQVLPVNGNTLNLGGTLNPGRYSVTVTDSQTPPRSISRDFFVSIRSTFDLTNLQTKDAPDDNTPTGEVKIDILPGVGPYRVNWGDGSPTITVPQGNPLTTASNTSMKAGQYTMTITDAQGCIEKRSYTIFSQKCATLFIPKDTLSCFGVCNGTATVIGVSRNFVAPYRYAWDNGEQGATAVRLCAGTRQIVVTDANNAKCTTTLVIKEPVKLEATMKVTKENSCLEALPTGGTTPYAYKWNTPKLDTTKKVCGVPAGRYFVLITDRNGCATLAEAEINPDSDCLAGALLISPNDDGKNDFFQVNNSGCDYKNIRVEVYNRWGALLYSKDDYRNTWFGNDQDGQGGNPIPAGVYMYIVRGTNTTGQLETVKGTVTIVRP